MTATTAGSRVGVRAAPSPEGPVRLRPVAGRRRPALAVGSAVLVVLCAAVAATEFAGAGRTAPVLALRRSVPAGSEVTASDLQVVRVHVPPDVAVVPATAEATVVGRLSATDLPVGSLLAPADVVAAYQPPPGDALVGIAVAAGQAPPGVAVGDHVAVVATSAPGTTGGAAPAGAAEQGEGTGPVTVVVSTAPVVSVSALAGAAGGATTDVSVAVPVAEAPVVAELSTAGQAALVVVAGSS